MREIEEKYTKLGLKNFKFRTAEDVKNVLGWDFRTCRGYKDLSPENRAKAEKLVCNYINGFGLGARNKERPKGIKFEGNRFKVSFKSGYSYLYLDGSIG